MINASPIVLFVAEIDPLDKLVNTLLPIVLELPENIPLDTFVNTLFKAIKDPLEILVDNKFGIVAVIVVRFDVLIKPVAKIFVVVIPVTLIVPLDKLVETKFVIVLIGV